MSPIQAQPGPMPQGMPANVQPGPAPQPVQQPMPQPGPDALTKDLEINEPQNFTFWQSLGQTGIGLAVGVAISFLLFVILTLVGGIFTDALSANTGLGGGVTQSNPLLPFILMIIAFLATLIGNTIVASLYNLFYSKHFYDIGKMLKLVVLTNVFLFLILAPVYLAFMSDVDNLFFVLAFHVFFSIFLSQAQINFVANPNYAGSYLIANTIGFAFSVLVYGLVHKATGTQAPGERIYTLMLLPSVLSYTLIPLFAGIWHAIYYKFYEMGNNLLYIPSLTEIAEEDISTNTEVEEDTVNVSM